jgi:hypothetical protein
MLDLLADPARREAAAAQAGEPVALAEVALRAPLTPTTMRDFVCFEAHVEGMVLNEAPRAKVPDDWYEAPTFYSPPPPRSSAPTTRSRCRRAARSSISSSRSA